MTPQQLADAEHGYWTHCRENYPAPSQVYAEDRALIDQIAAKCRKAAEGIVSDLADLHVQGPGVSLPILARLIAESLDPSLDPEVSKLLYAQVDYLNERGKVSEAVGERRAA